MRKEIWKQIEIFEGQYYISNLGRVINKKTGQKLKGDINNFGYMRVQLYNKGKRKRLFRHRLVATYFLDNPDPENKIFVNHKNGNKRDNTVYNLEWVTQSENEKHAFKKGLKRKVNKPVEVITNDGEVIHFESVKQLASKYKINPTTAGCWVRGENEGYLKRGISKIHFINA